MVAVVYLKSTSTNRGLFSSVRFEPVFEYLGTPVLITLVLTGLVLCRETVVHLVLLLLLLLLRCSISGCCSVVPSRVVAASQLLE